MSDQREQAEAQHRTAGLWNMMNVLKRNSDVERAAVAKANGIDPSTLPNFLSEIPFGNQTVVQQSAESKAPSALGTITKTAVLALAAGAAGFGLSQFHTEPEPLPPPPVNAVIEWEITPDGQSSSSVSSTELRVSGETSGGVDGSSSQ